MGKKKMPEGGTTPPKPRKGANLSPEEIQKYNIPTPTAPVDPIDQDVYNWTESYVNSPKYKERLSNFWKYPDYVQRQRADKLSTVGFTESPTFGQSQYMDTNAYPNWMQVNPNDLTGGIRRDEVVAHELGHVSNSSSTNPALRLNPLEENYIFNRNNKLTADQRNLMLQNASQVSRTNPTGTVSGYLGQGESHDNAPSENQSDIQSLRYLMNKNKIYDARTQDLTPEMLQKAKANPEIKKAFSPKRLFDTFNDTDLIDIMNKVAYQNTPAIQANPNMAKNGAKLSIYEEGGNLSRAEDYGSKSHPYPSVVSKDFAGPGRSYPIPTRANAVDALRLAGLHHNEAVKAKVYAKYPDLKKGFNGLVVDGLNPYQQGLYDAPSPQPIVPLGVDYIDDDSYYAQEAKSGIHINPANKGKFNATKKRTGKTTEELTHSKNPTTRKRAIFAQNAKKWHHGADGLTIPPFGRRAVSTPEDPIYYTDPTVQGPNQIPEDVRSYFSNPQNNQLVNDASLGGNSNYQQTLGSFRDQQFMNDPTTIGIQQSVSQRFQNDPFKNYIPNDTSLNGPDPYENEYLMNPQTGEVTQSDYTPLGQTQNEQTSNKSKGTGFNFNINPGEIMTGIMGAVNQIYDNQRGINENTRLKRRNAMAQGYNPNRYGTGSQAIFEKGGMIPGKEYDLTQDQINFLKSQGYDLEIL